MNKRLIAIATAITHNILSISYFFLNYFKSQVWFLLGISRDDENKILDTVIVMPLSTKLIDDTLPFRVRLEKQDDLLQDSDILINHIRAISKKRVTSFIGRVDDDMYGLIIDSLCGNFR